MVYKTQSTPNDHYVRLLNTGWIPEANMCIERATTSNRYSQTTWYILQCPEGIKVFSVSMGKSIRKPMASWVADVSNDEELASWKNRLQKYNAPTNDEGPTP